MVGAEKEKQVFANMPLYHVELMFGGLRDHIATFFII
jgi:hypothetical protein